jgi:2-methylcitrate dehydratase PrpD
LQVAGRSFPADEYQAKFSIPYCVAVALLKGRVGQEEFSLELCEGGAINDLLKKIKLIPDEGLGGIPGQLSAQVTVHTAGGMTFTESAHVRKGDPELPMTPDEKRDKFLKLTGTVWGDGAAERIFASIQILPEVLNVLHWAEDLRILADS